ncbi:hypothetical protein BDV93DRAFT_230996 [Ceratobasidium sp. AG-I]|nr:hypothetical protein BDV93DRAFT_230996 [Ceratobasidium sp. AG-I]
MFALQDCSICFEEYDSERGPHNIICGHVFCRPCLESLASSSPNCPNCRAPFAPHMIRKVVCARHDPPAPGAGVVSEAETVMWQTIQTAVGSAGEHEHRRSLVQNNSAWVVQAAGLSGVCALCIEWRGVISDLV